MAFDSKAFLRTKFERRTGEVPIEALKEFFEKGERPVWKVQSLTGQELGAANAAAERSQNLSAIVEAVQGRYKDKVKAFKGMLGLTDDMPVDVAKRIEMILVGSVEPDLQNEGGLDLALKILEAFPIEFYLITNEITKLTGQGHIVGKPRPSGKKKTSNTV
jgi:hypothetical protein